MAGNLTVHVHINEGTPITHVVHKRGEFSGTFASVEVGDAALLLDLDDIDRRTARCPRRPRRALQGGCVMAGSLASSGGVLYVDESVTVDPLDCGVFLDGIITGPVQLVTLDLGVLYRLAACAMVAADTLTSKLAAQATSPRAVAPR